MPERTETLRHWLALIRAPQIGPATFFSLLQQFTEPEAVFKASRSALEKHGLRSDTVAYINDPDWHQVDADLSWLDQPGAEVILLNDSSYPPLLKTIPDPWPKGRYSYAIARIHAQLGDQESAMEYLQRSFDEGFNTADGYRYHDDIEMLPLYEYPPFEKFVKYRRKKL